MGAVQLSLIEGLESGHHQGDLIIDLPAGLTKRESVSVRGLITRLWANSETSLKSTLADLWHKKCQHYTCEELLIRNLSRRIMVDEYVIRRWKVDLGLPGVGGTASCYRMMSLSQADYLTDDDELNDPLSRFVDQVYLTRKQQSIWERYCRLQGILLPEEIRGTDIRYVLQEAPISRQEFVALFQQEQYAFARYLHDSNLDVRNLSRFGVAVPLRTLVTKNARIRSILIRYAQALYTNRGIPISTIAQRLGIEPLSLWRMGDLEGAWILPTQQTLNDIIAESVISQYA